MSHALRALGAFGDLFDPRDRRFPLAPSARDGVLYAPAAGLPPVVDQLQLGSCVGQSVKALTEMKVDVDAPFVPMSARYFWWGGRLALNATDSNSGCFARDVLKFARTNGAAAEPLMPYRENAYRIGPTDAAYANGRLHPITEYYACNNPAEMQAALGAGHAFTFAFMVYENFQGVAGETGMMPNKPAVAAPRGAHQVVAYGFDPEMRLPGWGLGAYACMNWWGGDWGIPDPMYAHGPENVRRRLGCFWMPAEIMGDPDWTFSFWTVHRVPVA